MDETGNGWGEAPRNTLKVILEQFKIVREIYVLCRGPLLLSSSKPVFVSGAFEHLFYQNIFELLKELQMFLPFPSYNYVRAR